MNRFSFFMAFNGFVIISLLVYYFFPKEWKESRKKKAGLLIYHIIGVFSLELTFLIYKDIPYPWLQRLSVIISTFYYVPIMIMGIFFAAGAVIRFFWGRYTYSHPERAFNMKVPGAQRRAVLTALLAYLLTAAGFINMNSLHVTEYDVANEKMNGKEPLDICLIADTHAGSGNWDSLYDQLRTVVNNADPDVILIGGDVFDETTGPSDMNKLMDVFRSFEPELGMYYTLGNHDDPESQQLTQALIGSGAVSVEDWTMELCDGVTLTGRKDDGQERMAAEDLLGSVKKENMILVLQHRPTEFKTLSELGADLVMSGHTHGFNIPMIAAVYWNADSVYGRREYGNMTAVVTSGVSGWGFHYKFPAINEVVMIHLHGKD